jgi:hypothetical protein
MSARIAGNVLLLAVVFVVVSLLVSLGVMWSTDGVLRGVVIGTILGFSTAFVVSMVMIAEERSGERGRYRLKAVCLDKSKAAWDIGGPVDSLTCFMVEPIPLFVKHRLVTRWRQIAYR